MSRKSRVTTSMFKDFFFFELKLRLRSVSTYIYFLITFVMMILAVSVRGFDFVGTGKVLVNGPYALTFGFTQITCFGTILIAAIFGPAILRDFHLDTYQMIFTKPISKFAYLAGRWAGSFVVTVFVFSGLIWGAMAGTFMPWADKERLAPIHLWIYLQPFLSITVVQIFFLGGLFFCVAALTRRIVIVYLQGVVLFAFYLILLLAVVATNKLERLWASIVDPLGMVLVLSVTRYWTVAERNSVLMQWSGTFLYNRLLWISVGMMALFIAYVLFPMSAELLTYRHSGRRVSTTLKDDQGKVGFQPRFGSALPRVLQSFTSATTGAQLFSLTRLRFSNIAREVLFWAIAFIMVVLTLVNGYFAGQVNGVNVWPVTYLMAGVLQGSTAFFLYLIATMYAGELIWREHDVRFDQIHDSLPVRDSIDWLSKLLALSLMEFVVITIAMICGIVMQTAVGYHHYELGVYLKELYLIVLPQFVTFILLALFVHTVVGNKFVGHVVLIGFFVLIPILYRYGIENRLYLFGEVTPYTYSDMNGYGHFVSGLLWSICYWLFAGAVLGVLSMVFSRRGADLSWSARFRLARPRFVRLLPVAGLFFFLWAGCGAWFYYNTHILNEFRTSEENRHRVAEYERTYKKYERLPQPKIIAVDTSVDLYPERRAFVATGYYLLANHTKEPIDQIHITAPRESIDEIRFDRAFHLVLEDKHHLYRIYKLEKPLSPGETMRMDFRVSFTSHGFRDGNEPPEFAHNGTFFDREYFPVIGYNREMEIDDPVSRREEKLGPLEEMAKPGDAYDSNTNLFAADSEWVKFHTVVSTAGDQIAVAPGYLRREWTKNGRRYFEYDMGDVGINNLFSFVSARFAVKRDQWKDVRLEIYYQPGHEYNLDRMMDSIKSGLEYYEQNFGPYQFQQFRVLEFPRYRTFAESFANTVPYSEGIGFIERIRTPDDIDLLYFVTAHELAHQWWGHQLVGSATQGSAMLSESLAEYSALKVMERKYGPDMLRKELRYELDRYLRGRGGETRREPPLMLVQREPYVWYSKGALVMYALSDYIGEDRLNSALRSFLEKHRYSSAPFPDSREFVAALREVTPPEMQYLITDMFESIVLFDNKVVSATYTEKAGQEYKVTLILSAEKLQADGSGNESPMKVNDLIDVGVFSGAKEHLKPLYLAKQRFSEQSSTLEFVVQERPTFAGIDPYNKLIDRNPADNLIAVEKK